MYPFIGPFSPSDVLDSKHAISEGEGCYVIENKSDGKIYVGKSKNIQQRLKNHFAGYGGSSDIYYDFRSDDTFEKNNQKNNIEVLRNNINSERKDVDFQRKNIEIFYILLSDTAFRTAEQLESALMLLCNSIRKGYNVKLSCREFGPMMLGLEKQSDIDLGLTERDFAGICQYLTPNTTQRGIDKAFVQWFFAKDGLYLNRISVPPLASDVDADSIATKLIAMAGQNFKNAYGAIYDAYLQYTDYAYSHLWSNVTTTRQGFLPVEIFAYLFYVYYRTKLCLIIPYAIQQHMDPQSNCGDMLYDVSAAYDAAVIAMMDDEDQRQCSSVLLRRKIREHLNNAVFSRKTARESYVEAVVAYCYVNLYQKLMNDDTVGNEMIYVNFSMPEPLKGLQLSSLEKSRLNVPFTQKNIGIEDIMIYDAMPITNYCDNRYDWNLRLQERDTSLDVPLALRDGDGTIHQVVKLSQIKHFRVFEFLERYLRNILDVYPWKNQFIATNILLVLYRTYCEQIGVKGTINLNVMTSGLHLWSLLHPEWQFVQMPASDYDNKKDVTDTLLHWLVDTLSDTPEKAKAYVKACTNVADDVHTGIMLVR